MVLRAPESYVAWINAHLGFNPRSQANSNALAEFVITDLRETCPSLAGNMAIESVLAHKNADVRTRVAVRNVDLVFAEREFGPGAVRVSVENKTIMAAHGKARLNRYGDLIAYCNHVHNHRDDCVAGAIVVINCSPTYANPDAFAKDLKRPLFKMEKVVRDTVKIFAEIPLRSSPKDPNDQPEALAVIVVDYDGHKPAKLVTGDLGPQAENPVHYDNFLKRMCLLYSQRFGQQ